jgi:nucleoside-diphosphate-sugar epimerase
MTSVLVTGSAGFIATNLVSALVRAGDLVTGVDIHPAALPLARSIIADFADQEVLSLVRRGKFGVVLHNAAISNTLENDWDALREVNFDKSVALAEACATGGASSSPGPIPSAPSPEINAEVQLLRARHRMPKRLLTACSKRKTNDS